jgi:hypothetical protein
MPLFARLLPITFVWGIWVSGAAGLPRAAMAEEPAPGGHEKRFSENVQPFVKKYCADCHGAKKQEAQLDLSGYASARDVAKNLRVWELVQERLEAEEMPPEKAPRQPGAHERLAVVEWIGQLRDEEVKRNAGDPGPVLARRLSNAEFDYTIRDLTGVDIRPTREFPVDPANEAGFDNSGESLAMSAALVKKYLAASRFIADHVVLKPRGFVFAPHPAVTETDRDKYCVRRIIDFYLRHKIDYADYFEAAWRYRQRGALGKPDASLQDFAITSGLSPKYLGTIWKLLTEPESTDGPIAELLAAWRNLPDAEHAERIRQDCQELRDLVIRLRKESPPRAEKLHVKGISDGTQPFVLWRNARLAAQRMSFSGEATGETLPGWKLFCRIFPDAFVVSDRRVYSDADQTGEGRLLTAGFHLMQGYFRDDQPLFELVLDEAQKRKLDDLWKELAFVTLVPMRQYKDFIFFERAEPPRYMLEAEFDFARSEDKDATSEAKIERLREAYLVKARRIEASEQALEAMETYFTNISAEIREVERSRLAAEPSHLDSLVEFARRAYRRPLAPAEREELLSFYRRLRSEEELNHEDALRDTIASVLLSPHFCFRVDRVEAGQGARPLGDYALASRLSYFLWSSMPDEELLAHAAAGDLHRPGVLVSQARRMLRDERIRGLAVEFAGNWLEFRRFEEHNSVDRQRFASFTNELREAMYEEPIRFFVDFAARDRSILDLLEGDYTFVNPLLARHYGMEIGDAKPDEWRRVDQAHRFGRGGLLPMAVFLTKNAPGLRTSPVKRGYWVVRRLLGERIPAPPPNVPELPKDEADLGELTLPKVLARHRDNKACAGCHQRFDSIGLAFEGFGPIGERRELDLAGHPVEATATFPDGSEGTGLEGLRLYLSERRQQDFVGNFCRKLFSYALGRTLLPCDKATIDDMRARLASDGYRFAGLVETIVTSPQFLNKRAR